MESKVYKDFLALVQLGIGHFGDFLSANVDWQKIQDLASEQGLSAVVLDGIEEVRCKRADVSCNLPDKLMLTQWIGEVLQGYEYRYELYLRTLAEMAAFYREHGFKMMVLKGYACSINWPKPEHRPCGDIDIWLFGRQTEADTVLAKEKGIEIDGGRHHHSVFYWRDFMVENHYDFINTHRHNSHKGLEDIFKELGSELNILETPQGEQATKVRAKKNENSVGTRISIVEVYGEKVYLPSANLHALFLVRHALNHFASIGIGLRQMLDWAFFVEKNTDEIDWKWLNEMLEKYHMKDFYNCLNAICVENLGFDASIFHGVHFNPAQKDRILQEIMNPVFGTKEPKWLIPRMVYKYRRWKGSEWKRKLCYSESCSNSFWSGVWNTVLKPASI